MQFFLKGLAAALNAMPGSPGIRVALVRQGERLQVISFFMERECGECLRSCMREFFASECICVCALRACVTDVW